jgi:hypothetical protein
MNDSDYDYELKVMPNTVYNSKWRVKLYHLNPLGQWDDKGTGHVNISQDVTKFIYTG